MNEKRGILKKLEAPLRAKKERAVFIVNAAQPGAYKGTYHFGPLLEQMIKNVKEGK